MGDQNLCSVMCAALESMHSAGTSRSTTQVAFLLAQRHCNSGIAATSACLQRGGCQPFAVAQLRLRTLNYLQGVAQGACRQHNSELVSVGGACWVLK